MKKFKQIISLLMVASLMLAMFVATVSAAPAANTKYSVDLSIEKSVSDRFVFRALKRSDNSVAEVEDKARGTWDEDYLGFWVKGETDNSNYVVYDSEIEEPKFDLVCDGEYKSVLAFKAPADGYYDVYFKGNKYQTSADSFIDVTLAKNNLSEIYDYSEEVCGANGAGIVEFDVKGIPLMEGEEIWVVVDLNKKNTRDGGSNFGVLAFDVTYVGAEDPGTFVPMEGAEYKMDLAINKITSGRYYVSALKKSDNSVAKVEQTAEGTWDPAYIGHWVEGATGGADYVIYDTEIDGPIFDMVCDGDYKSVLAFKAPADGFYDVYFDANKYQGLPESIIDVTLMKKGATEALASKTGVCGKDGGGVVVFDVKNVELKKNDEIWLVITTNEENTSSGSSNFGIYKFDVTYIGTESGAEYIPVPGDKFEIDLSMEKPSSKRFYVSALNKADNRVAAVEQKARATWDEEWTGYWVKGAPGDHDYVIYETEKPENGYIFDQVCGGDYKSVLAFKAPADGIYNVYFKGNKYQWEDESVIDISLTKTGSTKTLASKNGVCLTDGKSGEVEFDVKNVWLSKGEEVWVVITTNKANATQDHSNFGVSDYTVTYVSAGEYDAAEGDIFKFDLALEEKAKGPFSLAGMKADGTIDPLKDSLEIAWGQWKGWWLTDGSETVFCETQVSNPKLDGYDAHGLLGEFAHIDMMPRTDASSVIIFTAPKTGTYKYSALFSKLKMSLQENETRGYKVEVIVGGKVIDSYDFKTVSPDEKHEDARFGGYIPLEENETIMFVASHVSGENKDMEIAVRDLQVTLVSFSTTYNPDSSDNMSFAVALLVLASLGIAVVSKKRR